MNKNSKGNCLRGYYKRNNKVTATDLFQSEASLHLHQQHCAAGQRINDINLLKFLTEILGTMIEHDPKLASKAEQLVKRR